ncbi:MAG TPA: hypothetical protein VJ124_11020 [Pyrinomonadaceae bacterium]|nr:hypothetical protein [Pyrinomonadaceae bacterium]
MRIFQLALMLVVSLVTLNVKAQSWVFTRGDLDYVLELPSPAWRAVSRVDVHTHVNFIYADDSTKAYLRLRKKVVDADATPADLFRYDEKWELQSLAGYVFCGECKGEDFEGHLRGTAFSYDYTAKGRAMAGRIYYLQMDKRTFCVLHFTVEREKLDALLDQMNFIARSIRFK